MYVCLRPLSMYVCLRRPSVCVCMSQAAKRVCMYASNIHTLSYFSIKLSLQRVWICFKNTTKHRVLKHTYTLKFLRISCFRSLLSVYVCLKTLCFVAFWACMYVSKHIVSCFLYERVLSVYVCLKTMCFVVFFCNSNITRGSEPQRFFKFSKRYRARYYINTSIHTYIPSFRPSH